MYVIILAAGNGTRMKSSLPKCLSLFKNKSFIFNICNTLSFIPSIEKIFIIIQSKFFSLFFNDLKSFSNIDFIFQDEPKGTGHALFLCSHLFDKSSFLVLNGDMPAISLSIINSFLSSIPNHSQIALLSSYLSNPVGYGRIIISNNDIFIKEEKDCSILESNTKLCNLGIYWFQSFFLNKYISLLDNNNIQNEYYITQLVSFIDKSFIHIYEINSNDLKYCLGVNSPQDLIYLESLY